MKRYRIPDADRERLRALRTTFAHRLSDEEHDQLAGIILRGRITPAESQIVAALHARFTVDVAAVQGGGSVMPLFESVK